jgi:DeoR family glycerol-3-phosphate regulon repressor
MTRTRQDEIVAMVERRGYVSVERLAMQLEVTPQTIRRDLNQLCDRGILERQHGGVSLPTSRANSSYGIRHIEAAEEKELIARRVVESLPDKVTVFLSLGTTIEAVAHALVETSKPALVVTNSIEIAHVLWRRSTIETVLTGGVMQHRNGGLVGNGAVESVLHYRCDFLISSAGSVEPDGTVMEFYDSEIAVVGAMRANARGHILALDSRKFHKTANQKFCDFSELTALVTDKPPPDGVMEIARRSNVEVLIAERHQRALADGR